MRQGLEALELPSPGIRTAKQISAITALREALKCKYGNEPTACTSSPMDCQCAIDAALESPEPPPECQTHAEKTAFAFGWFKAMEKMPEQPTVDPCKEGTCSCCWTHLDEQPAQQETVAKLWLWRNFVNGRPEYWAFDNPYPINLDNDDPQTLGSPCGYALLKPSRDGSRGRTEDEVLREINGALAREYTHPKAREPLTDEEAKKIFEQHNCVISADLAGILCRAIEAALKEKNT